MALYEIPDQVVKNILIIVNEAVIKGNQAEAIIEIKNYLNRPVDINTVKNCNDKE